MNVDRTRSTQAGKPTTPSQTHKERFSNIVRLVSCHPDFDGMEMTSALLIADGKILHGGSGVKSWADFKTQLT